MTTDLLIGPTLGPCLNEPTSHPEAEPLARLAEQVIMGEFEFTQGALCIVGGFPGTVEVARVEVRWHGRLVLLAVWGGDVWCYHAGRAWEEVLRQVAQGGTSYALS